MLLRATLAALLLILLGCAKSEPIAEKIEKNEKNEPLKTYALFGRVARLDEPNKIATIEHEPIGDWMGAMTMDFPVKESADFAKLATGKTVEATVFVQGVNYWVGQVK